MDRRDNQLWRKNLRRVDETETEFDLYFQGAVREITLRERLRRAVQLLEGTASPVAKRVSGWRDLARNAYYTGKSLFFRKKL